MPRRIALAIAAVASIALAGAARAQVELEAVTGEPLQKAVAYLSTEVPQKFPAAAVKITPDGDRAIAYKHEHAAFLLLPTRGLSAKSVADAGTEVVPVGWLVLRGIAPVAQGNSVPSNRLATLQPDANGPEVSVLFLGVRKDGDKRVLEVYSREPKPLLQAPLTPLEKPHDAARPLDATVSGVDQAARQADLQVTLSGGFAVTLRLGAAQ